MGSRSAPIGTPTKLRFSFSVPSTYAESAWGSRSGADSHHTSWIRLPDTAAQTGNVAAFREEHPKGVVVQLKEAAEHGNVLLLLNRHGTSQFVGLSVENDGTTGSSR
jgi:hypothetical protein